MTLPQVQQEVSALVRVAEGAATAVAGHVSRAFEDPQQRHRLLGLPVGRSGYRSSADFVEKTQHVPVRQTRDREDRAARHLAAVSSPDGPAEGASSSGAAAALWSGAVDPAVVDAITRTLDTARQAASRARAPKEWQTSGWPSVRPS